MLNMVLIYRNITK